MSKQAVVATSVIAAMDFAVHLPRMIPLPFERASTNAGRSTAVEGALDVWYDFNPRPS